MRRRSPADKSKVSLALHVCAIETSRSRLRLASILEENVTPLTWSHECIVGVEAMDDQHGILMDTLNELRITLVQGANRRDLCVQLERLIEFTRMHFQCEEHLLRQQLFPEVNEHQTAHNQLLSKLRAALEHLN